MSSIFRVFSFEKVVYMISLVRFRVDAQYRRSFFGFIILKLRCLFSITPI